MNTNGNLAKKELYIDDTYKPIITPDETTRAIPIIKTFVKSYLENKDVMDKKDWLEMELQNHLPNRSVEEIKTMSGDIVYTVNKQEDAYESLKKDMSKGRSKDAWLDGELKRATENMSAAEASKYYQEVDQAISIANENLAKVALTKDGLINQNPHLDGFIAEQHHADTFNINAKASGSEYTAEVLPAGEAGFEKDSVDIIIKDAKGNVVEKYQSKYYKDAKSTEDAFKHGNYDDQQKLVPKGQAADMEAEAVECISAPDGTKSEPLTKSDAKDMQDTAQSGEKQADYDYKNVSNKDLAKKIAGQTGLAAALGGAMGAGTELFRQFNEGEDLGKHLIITVFNFLKWCITQCLATKIAKKHCVFRCQ